MGVKRTQGSGRRDSLGREIKVSGHTSERAGESSVDARESGARSDFPGETIPSWEPGSDIETDPSEMSVLADSLHIGAVDYEVDASRPGCEGCDPGGRGYEMMCDCYTIDNVIYDEDSNAERKDEIALDAMQRVGEMMFHRSSPDDSVEVIDQMIASSGAAKGFRDIVEDDFEFEVGSMYSGGSVDCHPSAQLTAECADALLADEKIGKMFADRYFGGRPLTVEGVTDFLESSGKSVPEGASTVSLKYMARSEAVMSDAERRDRLASEHEQSNGRRVYTNGLVAIVDSGGEVLDGYWRVTGTHVLREGDAPTASDPKIMVLEVS